MLELLTFNNDIMELILQNIDTESHLIVGLTCKEMYKILKTFNENKKLNGLLEYITSTLSLLKYAHENGCPWHESTSHRAAYNGHLECLKYCHENGCPFSPYTCIVADRNGHLECVKYCRDNWLS